jgi:hypothetical protein
MIRTKRDSLEKFIRQQMEGPGACNDHFCCLNNECNDVNEEVINTTPGSLYSTAILFPQRKQVENVSSNNPESSNIGDDPDLESDSSYQEAQDDNSSEELDERVDRLSADEEDLYSLSQRFPTTIGISCCLDKNGEPLLPSDLTINVSGRYYTKISKEESGNIIVKIEDESGFKQFFEKYKSQLDLYFSIIEGGIHLAKDVTKDISAVKDTILTINKELCKCVAINTDGTIDNEYEQIGNNYRYLKSYKERLWRKLKYFKDTYLADNEKMAIEERIKDVERYETYLSYLEDAMNICNTKSFGFWQSHSFNKVIDLNGIDLNKFGNKVIFSPRENEYKNNLNILFEDDYKLGFLRRLSVWLQITRLAYGSKNKIYLKVQLENSSTPFEEDSEHYFSIVTEKVNERCFFGVQIKIESKLLTAYQERNNESKQEDVEHLNYLYRSIKDYAVGHLCSVDWKISNNEKWVRSEFIPSYETPDVEPIPRDKYSYIIDEDGIQIPQALLEDSRTMEFKWLSIFSDTTDEEILSHLKEFVGKYQMWIDKQRDVLHNDQGENHIGFENLDKCQLDCDRMVDNIKLILDESPSNMMSFRLMNTAMFIQLWHSKKTTDEETCFDFYKEKADDHLFGNKPAAWRPFQLAFILLNLDGIIQRSDDPKWKCRNELVDLVWFPTGGGKTEAYLGIIALSIIFRRRQYPVNGGGTTAIMRYTLRLLATQQFQRAMRLILALEQLRRWDKYDLGNEPISIGLFVGEDSLPNNAKSLSDECQKWNTIDNSGKRRESKIPLDKCPCCGRLLKYQNKGSITDPKIVFRCDNIDCTFSDELPVKLCDEYIFQNPPTLLFGTVDKFAALGHKVSTSKEKQDSRRLFGTGGLHFLPPSLIIQDELHLLLGPLGSAVSLFECAIDQLCSYKNDSGLVIRPKIISSTATTRNTELQIRALYDRDVSIFPKPGADYDDSFFSFYQRKKVDGEVRFVSKRKYLGIFPTGRTHMTTQMRLIATMFVHRALFEKEHAESLSDKEVQEAMDYYHSIIDYFNSLKEVGKADAQFYTEFTKYTRRLFKRVLRYSDKLECLYGYDSSFSKSELTGRLSGAEVVNELEKVGRHWKAEERLPHMNQDGGEWLHGTTPPDLILATNMISVGLDVDRFNTIIMNSMPRNIAEYIQASSRVARNKLGLVITLHNPFRARDLSHFERFKEFHEKLYYYVEPISITPFSKKSVCKYLPLYNATMIRHHYDTLANPDNASALTTQMQNTIKNEMFVYFRKRLERTQKLSSEQKELLTEELEEFIELFIEEALNRWQGMVDNQQTGEYSLRYSGSDFLNSNGRQRVKWKDLFLALDAYLDDEAENMWAVPMSLRTVESEAVLNIKDN